MILALLYKKRISFVEFIIKLGQTIIICENSINQKFEFFFLCGELGCRVGEVVYIGEAITEFQIQGLFLLGRTHSHIAIRVKDSY